MSTATLASSSSSCNSGNSAFWSIGKVATFLDCSEQTVRNLVDSGEILSTLTLGGHRRISVRSLEKYAYGLSEEDKGNYAEKKCVVYIRVSTEKQNSAGSLCRQRERLTEEVAKREGMPIDSIPVYSDVASSFGSRDSLNRLVDDIIDGKIGRIYCEYLDRLSRVPGLTHMINHLCERFGVEVVCLDSEDSEDSEVYQKELLNFLTVWCNRQSAAKAKKVTEKNVDEKCLARMMELRVKGFQIKQIVEQIQKEGWLNNKGEPVSYSTVRKYLDNNGRESVVKKIVGTGGMTSEQLVTDFAAKFITKKEDGRITTNEIYGKYEEYCEKLSVIPQVKSVFGVTLSRILKTKAMKSNGVRYWPGYEASQI